MKRIITISLLLLAVALTVSADRRRLLMARNVAVAPYLITENFEGTGYEGAWTITGSPNPDYATAPAPLEGAQSWLSTTSDSAYTNFTATANVWAYAMVVTTNIVNSPYLLNIASIDGGYVLRVRIMSAGGWRVYNGPSANASGGVSAQDTVYHLWVNYVKGTGSDSQVHLFVSTTSTKPGTATLSHTTGTNLLDAARFYLAPSVSNPGMIADKIIVSAENIGSNP